MKMKGCLNGIQWNEKKELDKALLVKQKANTKFYHVTLYSKYNVQHKPSLARSVYQTRISVYQKNEKNTSSKITQKFEIHKQ